MNKSTLYIMGATIVVVILGYFGYTKFYNPTVKNQMQIAVQDSQASNSNTTQQPLSTNQNQKDLSAYSDKYGLNFKYPSNLTVKQVGGDISLLLADTATDSQIDTLRSYFQTSPLVESVSIIKFNSSGSVAEITMKKVPNSYDPDEIFGQGFTARFTGTLRNMIYHGPILQVYDSNKELLLQLNLGLQQKDNNPFNSNQLPVKELNSIIWAIPEKNNENQVNLEGDSKIPVKGASNFIPQITITNTNTEGIYFSRSTPLKFYQSIEAVNTAEQIMKTLIIK